MKLVLLGKPLSGKGTQAALLSKALDISVLSLGALFRREVEKKCFRQKSRKIYEKRDIGSSFCYFSFPSKISSQKRFHFRWLSSKPCASEGFGKNVFS